MQPAGTLAGRTANSIHWSPQGRNLVLAGLKVWRCLHAHPQMLTPIYSCPRQNINWSVQCMDRLVIDLGNSVSTIMGKLF